MSSDMDREAEIRKWINSCPRRRLLNEIREENQKLDRTLVILDDDPTGTQTVHDVPVVTVWDADTLSELFGEKCPLFYILTNSRSLAPVQAEKRVKMLTGNTELASKRSGRKYQIILRSDSTLRGHHPGEMDAVFSVLPIEPELRIIHPAFIEGGRVTFDNTHYALDDNRYIPCGETQFARDLLFGYTASHLRDWIMEKTHGETSPDQIAGFTIDTIRDSSVEELVRQLHAMNEGTCVVADALGYYDVDKFCLALLRSRRSFIARTAASFVASAGGIEPIELLNYKDFRYGSGNGGIIIAGSFVEKTTKQIRHLADNSDIVEQIVDVKQLLQSPDRESYLQDIKDSLQLHLANKQDVLVYTSREFIAADPGKASGHEKKDHEKTDPDIGSKISTFISDLIGSLSVTPSFLIAKGGITSSDIATKSLRVKRAQVRGQIHPGVPVWELGGESKYPGLNYVIFPGNVGGDDALLAVYNRIKGTVK